MCEIFTLALIEIIASGKRYIAQWPRNHLCSLRTAVLFPTFALLALSPALTLYYYITNSESSLFSASPLLIFA